MRIRTMVAVVVVLVLLVVAGSLGLGRWIGGLSLPTATRTCTVEVPGTGPASERSRRLTLNAEQMASAATIAAIGVRRRMPERAVMVALATAFQESKLHNLAGGDRDSVGLFQQRPSQGWGTVEEIRDTRHATNAFYTALKKVRGWQDMRVTDAAQAVQRSAFPEAYEKWADESELLTDALLGDVTGAVACTVDREPAMRGDVATDALTAGLLLDWGDLGPVAMAAGRPGLTVPASDARSGWRYAHWLVSHATDHGVRRVSFAELEWTAENGDWAPTSGTTPALGTVAAEVFV